jgi:hypothetical protein
MICKTRAIYIKNILSLDFVRVVTDIQILKHYVSYADSTSVYIQVALKMLVF